MHDDLHVLRLPSVAFGACNGEVYEVIPVVALKSRRDRQTFRGIASLVEREARGSGGIRGFIWVISVRQSAHEEVLIWVELLIVGATTISAPGPSRRRHTDWCSASLAAIFALHLAMAFAKSSSLHREQILWTVLCIPVWVAKRDW